MLIFSFTEGIAPVAWARARDVRDRYGRTVRKVNPPELTAFERHMGYLAAIAMRKAGTKRVEEAPVWLACTFYFAIPDSWSKRKREEALAGAWHHTSPPDLSNLVKAVEDGLNGVAWSDDRQVAHLSASKRWAERNAIEVAVHTVVDSTE